MGSELSKTCQDQYKILESKSVVAYDQFTTALNQYRLERAMNPAQAQFPIQTANCASGIPRYRNDGSEIIERTEAELHAFMEDMEKLGETMCHKASGFFAGGNCTYGHGTTYNIHDNGSITTIISTYEDGYRVIKKYKDGKFFSESRKLRLFKDPK